MNSLYQLFLANLKIVCRNRSGLFWTIVMPVGLYVALSVLPIPAMGGTLYKDFVLPGMITYTIMSGGIYGLAYWMTDMKARGVIKRFLVTPINIRDLILGLIASRLVIMIAQAVLLTLIGVLILDAKFAGNIFSSLIIVLLGGGIFLLIGLLIANFASSYESAAPLTTAIGMPFAFLGNIFFPVSALPHGFEVISKFLPVTYLTEGLRQAYLFTFDFEKLGKDILFLTGWFILILIITVSVFRLKED